MGGSPRGLSLSEGQALNAAIRIVQAVVMRSATVLHDMYPPWPYSVALPNPMFFGRLVSVWRLTANNKSYQYMATTFGQRWNAELPTHLLRIEAGGRTTKRQTK